MIIAQISDLHLRTDGQLLKGKIDTVASLEATIEHLNSLTPRPDPILATGDLVNKARESGLAGATVIRGLEGFGAHSKVHTAKILRLSSDLPVVVEIVDTRERVEEFLPLVDGAIKEGMATLEDVTIRLYRKAEEDE